LLAACPHRGRAQPQPPLQDTAPANPAVPSRASERAVAEDSWFAGAEWLHRRSLNGDVDSLSEVALSFGKRLSARHSLGVRLGGGVLELEPGRQADAVDGRPVFVELGAVWRYDFMAAPDALWKPYITAAASVLWMGWDYRHTVDSDYFGNVSTDFLGGLDGTAGVGLSGRLWRRLRVFGEISVGGVVFHPRTYSGVDNDLFDNFGYVGVNAGFRLAF
jgi:hypothetical protein